MLEGKLKSEVVMWKCHVSICRDLTNCPTAAAKLWNPRASWTADENHRHQLCGVSFISLVRDEEAEALEGMDDCCR